MLEKYKFRFLYTWEQLNLVEHEILKLLYEKLAFKVKSLSFVKCFLEKKIRREKKKNFKPLNSKS